MLGHRGSESGFAAVGPERLNARDDRELAGGKSALGGAHGIEVECLGLRGVLEHQGVRGFGGEAHLAGQGRGREEAEARGQAKDIAKVVATGDREGNQADAAGGGDIGQVHARDQAVGSSAQITEDRGLAVEVAEEKTFRGLERQSGRESQPAAGLKGRFKQDRPGHEAVAIFEVPGVRRDVVLGDHGGALLGVARGGVERMHAREELVGRRRQAGQTPRPVERRVGRAEGVARLADGGGENGDIVERLAGELRGLPAHLGLDGEIARERNVGGQSDAEALRVESLHAVDGAQEIRDERRLGTVVYFGHEDLVDELARGGQSLTAAAKLVRHLRHGLEAPGILVESEAAGGQIERHGLQTPFEHQRAGHAGIVLEVALEEPVVLVQVEHRAHVAAAPRPAGHVDRLDFVDEEHVLGRDPRGHGVSQGAQMRVSEGVADPAFRKGNDILA